MLENLMLDLVMIVCHKRNIFETQSGCHIVITMAREGMAEKPESKMRHIANFLPVSVYQFLSLKHQGFTLGFGAPFSVQCIPV